VHFSKTSSKKEDEGKRSENNNFQIFFVELENYLTEEFQLGETASQFISKHAPIFRKITPDDIPLPCFDAYQEYQALFEQKVENFCSDRNVEHRKFLEWCRLGLEGASESDGGSREVRKHLLFLLLLLSGIVEEIFIYCIILILLFFFFFLVFLPLRSFLKYYWQQTHLQCSTN